LEKKVKKRYEKKRSPILHKNSFHDQKLIPGKNTKEIVPQKCPLLAQMGISTINNYSK